MLKKEEFPIAAFRPRGPIELTCPVCGNLLGYEYLPLNYCRDCGATFDFKVVVYYKEEDSEL